MSAPRSRGHRLIALVIAASLIGGGTAGLTAANQVPLAVVSSAAAILAGLLFLRRAARRST